MKNNFCAPSKIITKTSSIPSCYSYDMLLLLIRLYNDRNDDKIEISTTTRPKKKDLWLALKNKLKSCGDNEACWLEQPFAKRSKAYKDLQSSFKPEKPKSWNRNPEEWLNTYDILNVMKQYEEANKTYKFIGVYPIDFAAKNTSTGVCVVQEMCKLELAKEWKKGVKRIGVVFNTDKSTGTGEHWLSLYIGMAPNSKNFGIFFYDSVAMSPPKELRTFMKSMQKELENLHPQKKDKIEFRINKVRRQYKNNNCGIFSIVFQILMLKYKYDDVCKHMGYDDDVQKFRDILYRPNNDIL